ncbi:MAG: polysaccharide biosynthesis C-terminal domain-containing protein, partial [Enterococcus sp.]|nr:polysaccharide biosynthesis C-terminal domain-containing protein [Enterococcus sp.]
MKTQDKKEQAHAKKIEIVERVMDEREDKHEAKIGQHFGYKGLLAYTFPTIITLLVISTFSVIDGIFVSNFPGPYSGETSLAAINLAYPLILLFITISYVVGIGGNAIIAATLGEKKLKRARQIFSMLFVFTGACGIVFFILYILLDGPFLKLMGATGTLYSLADSYGFIISFFIPIGVMQSVLSYMFISAGKPGMNIFVSLSGGITNLILDFLFVFCFGWGVQGAALATGLGYAVAGMISIVYFVRRNSSSLHLVKPIWDWRILKKTITNGFSELVANFSESVIVMIFNFQLMLYIGENGVAAYSALEYVGYVFISVLYGFVEGAEPIVSYNYGAKNYKEQRGLFKKIVVIICVMSITMFLFAEIFGPQLVYAFVGYSPELF